MKNLQPELAHPYDVLSPVADIVVASPKGGVSPVDLVSVEEFKDDEYAQWFYRNKQEVWENTTPIKEFLGRSGEFDAIFYPGGHGPMFDLTNNAESIQLIEEFYNAGKPIASVCHGPAAFTNVKVDGELLIKGRNITGFTNEEEKASGLAKVLPFLLEDRLNEVGVNFLQAPKPWESFVVVDGQIITGQNPGSAKEIGQVIARELSKSSKHRKLLHRYRGANMLLI